MGGDHYQVIQTGSFYPESVKYNKRTGRHILSSVRYGGIYTVEENGAYQQLVSDDRLIGSIGIQINEQRDRLYVVNSDLGVSVRKSSAGTNRLASLGIYELSSGNQIDMINLGDPRPNGEPHFTNDPALDDEGNVYITDSLAPVIYKVDTQGNASVFLEDADRLVGEGFSLNGIAYHPDGYFIVAKKNEGILFKVPLANPSLQKIEMQNTYLGADGVVLVNENELVLIANRVAGKATDGAIAIMTNDGWKTAQATGEYLFTDDEYPTTGVLKDGKVFILHSRINTLLGGKSEMIEHTEKAVLQQVGTVE